MPEQERTGQAPLMPERIGRYEVLLPLARGGMATVYLARSLGARGFEREVAIKLPHEHLCEQSGFANDLFEEASLAVRIRHRNVVSVLDVGDDPRGLFLVMDYVHGDTLSNLRKYAERSGQRVPPAVGLKILIDALAGLHAAHELRDDHGRVLHLVHRDFSPQNILVGTDGVAQLTDFGIAKAASRLGETATGILKGKIKYMSPEQARGEPMDRRTDVWAAGVVAWELLAGRSLYPEENDVVTLLRVVSEQPPRLRALEPSIPLALDEAIASALKMDREERCPSAAAFAQRLTVASRDVGLVADALVVSQYVEQTVGPKLQRLRARVAEVIALRDRMGQVVGTGQAELASSPQQPENPGLSRDIPTLPESAQTPLTSSPLLPDTVKTTRPKSFEADPPTLNAPQAAPPRRLSHKMLASLIGSAAAVLLAVVAAGYESQRSNAKSAPTSPPLSASTTSSAQAPASVDSPLASISPEPLPTTRRSVLVVSANSPIQSLRIGGRLMPITPPDKRVEVDTSTLTCSKDCHLEAQSSDGRVARIDIARETEAVALQFPPRAVVVTQPSPLATNPYGATK